MRMLKGRSQAVSATTSRWLRMAGCAIALPALLALGGCISSSSPSPPANTTVVVPNGSTVVCGDGGAPPCR